MTGFNYIRTPASQLARRILAAGEIGKITWFRAEHTEDFCADPLQPASWRTRGRANGNMGDLAPHIINAALAFMGPISSLCAAIETVHGTRPSEAGPEEVTNDDQGQIMCRFAGGAMGHLFISRVATGRKMGFAYEVFGTEGALRFDQEDQNALWLYRSRDPRGRQGFTKLLTGPEHPDYGAFCLGPGHGTGYQDQIIIEARDFLEAIATGKPKWPTFEDGHMVNQVIDAAWASQERRGWVDVAPLEDCREPA
jgi:predicted dehydrogenase